MAKPPNVFDVLMRHNYVILFRSENDRRYLSVRMKYRNGKRTGFVLQRKVVIWITLVRSIGMKPIDTYILTYSWNNFVAGAFKHTII